MVDLTNRPHHLVPSGQNLTLTDLKSFADKLNSTGFNGSLGDAIRAVRTDQGIMLYAKSTGSSSIAKFFGVAAERRKLAQDVIRDAVSNTLTPLKQTATSDAQKRRVENLEIGLQNLCSKAMTLRAAPLHGLLELLPIVQHSGKTPTASAAETTLTNGIGAAKVASMADTVATAVTTMAAAAKAGGATSSSTAWDAAEKKLVGEMKAAILQVAGPAPDNTKLAKAILLVSNPLRTGLADAVERELTSRIGRDEAGAAMRSQDGPVPMIHAAVEKASAELLGAPLAKVTAQTPATGGASSQPPDNLAGLGKGTSSATIRIGNTDYKFDRELARGGSGAVISVTAPDGTGLVLKVPHSSRDPGDTRLAAYADTNYVEEMLRQKAAGGAGHPHIVQSKGVFVMEDGRAGFALEKGVGKDGANVMMDIHNTPNNPNRLADALLVFRDASMGVAEMHKKGMTDGDLKPEQVLQFPGGVFKLADYGTVQFGGKFNLLKSTAVESPLTQAPETLESFAKMEATQGPKGLPARAKNFIRDNIFSDLPDRAERNAVDAAFKDGFKSMQADTSRPALVNAAATSEVSPTSDTWQMGIFLYRMAAGDFPFAAVNPGDARDEIMGMPMGATALGPNGYFAGKTTGDADVDRLINKMLVRDPKARPTMDKIVADPDFALVMKKFDVASDAQRARLAKAAGG